MTEGKPDPMRFVLKQRSSGAEPARAVDRAVAVSVKWLEDLDPDIKVVASAPGLFLVECSEAAGERIAKKARGWIVQPERFATVPEPRPRGRRVLRKRK